MDQRPCFQCGKPGHVKANWPELQNGIRTVDEVPADELVDVPPGASTTLHDLSQLTAALRDGVDLPAGGGAYHFATTPIEGPLPAMRTSRVSQDVAQLLGELKGEASFDSLTRTRPELVQAAKQLSEAGLLTLASST